MKLRTFASLCTLALAALSLPARAQNGGAPDTAAPVPHVIQISVDALGAKYLSKFMADTPDDFPNFARLVKEGASTMNARTDFDFTITLPNHTCMLTGRPVQTPAQWPDAKGHGWTWNKEFPSPDAPASLHATNPDAPNAYTSSTFDVAHDAGLSTALYSGKTKFALFTISYGPDLGADNARGKNKIDSSVIIREIHAPALADLKAKAPNYAFWHYPEPDTAGHAFGYLGAEYRDSVKKIDGFLGETLAFIETDPEWKGRTVVIVSADHGGQPETKNHINADNPYNYTIPFFVWGAGVAKGADLYHLNAQTRANPGDGRPQYAPTNQPIRNGDGGNLALQLLGLGAIPGSSINRAQDLKVR